MKALKLSLLIFFCVQSTFAQENGTLFLSAETLKKYSYSYELDQYRLEHFNPERFSNSDWKYHPGDDLRWKEPSFSDTDWTLFRTDFSLDSISPDAWKGIGWFRLKLSIDSSLYNQLLALVITHYGASEVYLDGKLVNQYGIPGKDPAIEKKFRPLFLQPILISLDDKAEHLLAVRYSFQNANKLFDKYGSILWHINDQNGSAGFIAHFGDSKEAVDLFSNSLKKNIFFAAITFCTLFLIGSFHLILFLFYSRYRSNLYLSIFNLTLAFHSLFKFLPTYTHMDLQAIMLVNFFGVILSSLWIPVTMLAYYSVFYPKLPRYTWLYFVSTILMAYIWIVNHALGEKVILWISLIAFADMMRLFIKSVIKKDKYVWIVGIGVLLSQSTLVLYFVPSLSMADRAFLIYPVFLSVPIALSIFNAIRTAGTSKSLEEQLKEVKRLSELSIAQEKDKQQILTSQKETLEIQVQERTVELKQSLENLRATQSQLILSEKMASLGELTAGIAHEIQNPLNFVNNFSEVNKELADELQQELKAGKIDDAIAISNDIKDNEEKINHHGKRADAIVKGMLQHSRSSSGVKEPTNINALADEYLRLAYHGLRAKDNSFNATIKTDFDKSIGNINIIPQDIGRVVLNLINNAFYVVDEKKTLRQAQGDNYEPTVSVSTKKEGSKVLISVKDNGNGIPQKVLDKIFQPFFTTKPTGQGTGLGLSLSYDIVKAHGGELKVETKEGEGAAFIIQIPIK
jgi:signal transduction histidine kinase